MLLDVIYLKVKMFLKSVILYMFRSYQYFHLYVVQMLEGTTTYESFYVPCNYICRSNDGYCVLYVTLYCEQGERKSGIKMILLVSSDFNFFRATLQSSTK